MIRTLLALFLLSTLSGCITNETHHHHYEDGEPIEGEEATPENNDS